MTPEDMRQRSKQIPMPPEVAEAWLREAERCERLDDMNKLLKKVIERTEEVESLM